MYNGQWNRYCCNFVYSVFLSFEYVAIRIDSSELISVWLLFSSIAPALDFLTNTRAQALTTYTYVVSKYDELCIVPKTIIVSRLRYSHHFLHWEKSFLQIVWNWTVFVFVCTADRLANHMNERKAFGSFKTTYRWSTVLGRISSYADYKRFSSCQSFKPREFRIHFSSFFIFSFWEFRFEISYLPSKQSSQFVAS